ncbi:DUF6709 family protein [Gemmiger sp.]
MLQSLKQKTLVGKLWIILGLAEVAAVIGVWAGPGLIKLVRGPAYIEPMDDNDLSALQGRYLAADVDTLIDYYAETVTSESGKRGQVTSRDYVMPINTPDQTVYIGVEIPKSKLADAEAVVADTEHFLADEDGYTWDGSYVSVRGTLQPMDAETEALFRNYLYDAGITDGEISLAEDSAFRPLVLVDGEVNGERPAVLIFMGLAALALGIAAFWTLLRALTGGYQKQIRAYIAASDDPQGTEQALDRFYEDTMREGPVRMSRSWLLYVRGGDSWVLAGDDVVWAYRHTLRRKLYGLITVGKDITVKVYSASEAKNARCHTIRVRSEDEAHKLLEDLQRTYPDALIGYAPEAEAKYNADPAVFHKAVIAAKRRAREKQTTEV